jgi:hypothetical protein
VLGSIFLFIALRRFRRSSGEEVDISRLIPKFLKKGKNGAEFQYRSIISYGEDPRAAEVFYFDAPYRIVLYGGKNNINISVPIACVAFDKVGSRSICIKQIQGTSYGRLENEEIRIAALREIKWERLLVQIVCEWARINRVKWVKSISSKKSYWYGHHNQKQLFMRYDVTARRMGFRESSEEGIYQMDLSQLRSFE